MTETPLLTTNELAAILRVSPRHLFRIKSQLPYIKAGRSLRWELGRVIAVLRQNEQRKSNQKP